MVTKIGWLCVSCDANLNPEEMLNHLQEVHNLDRKKTTISKRRPIVFGDAKDYSIQQWEWVIEGLNLIQTIEVEG